MDPTTVAQALAAYAQPARPVTPTPTSQDDIMEAVYGPQTPPPPLPSWVPQNVQNYINTQPSYGEGERQSLQPPSITRGDEPYDQTPQIGDIQRLFQGRITRNAPTGDERSIRADQFRALMKLPGFSGFTGGDEI
jgi:hypothetical protein